MDRIKPVLASLANALRSVTPSEPPCPAQYSLETLAKRSTSYLAPSPRQGGVAMVDSQLFVVRVWQALSGGFRASVRRVDDDQTHHFDRPDAVTRFLTDECPGASGADRSGSAAGDGGGR